MRSLLILEAPISTTQGKPFSWKARFIFDTISASIIFWEDLNWESHGNLRLGSQSRGRLQQRCLIRAAVVSWVSGNLEFGEKSGESAELTVCWRVELSSRCRIPCSWIAQIWWDAPHLTGGRFCSSIDRARQ